MFKFLKEPKRLVIILSVLFCVVIVLFCYFDATRQIKAGYVYTSDEIKAQALEKININTATVEQLVDIPSVGVSTATNIINYRQVHGKFKTTQEVMNVKGIGYSDYLQMLPYIEI